jgi:hypothetical protein
MARRIPHVADGGLHVLEPSVAPQIPVGSPAWAAWLADPATRSFSFRGSSGIFTVLKERCSGRDWYWTAYRKRGGKLPIFTRANIPDNGGVKHVHEAN